MKQQDKKLCWEIVATASKNSRIKKILHSRFTHVPRPYPIKLKPRNDEHQQGIEPTFSVFLEMGSLETLSSDENYDLELVSYVLMEESSRIDISIRFPVISRLQSNR